MTRDCSKYWKEVGLWVTSFSQQVQGLRFAVSTDGCFRVLAAIQIYWCLVNVNHWWFPAVQGLENWQTCIQCTLYRCWYALERIGWKESKHFIELAATGIEAYVQTQKKSFFSVKKEPVPCSFFSLVYIQKASVFWPVRSFGWNVNYALTSGSWVRKGDKLPKWSKNCICGETHVRERNHILRPLLRGNGCSLTGSSEKSKGIYFLLLKRCAFCILIRSSTL